MAADLLPLAGRAALVTGSARGIGWGIAQALARAGAHVVVNDLDEAVVAGRAQELRAAGYLASHAAFDITNEAAVTAGVACISTEAGPVDVLVNNAGIQRRAFFHEFSYADWRAVIDTHVNGSFLVTRAVVPAMMKRRFGRIVFIGSIAVQQPKQAISAYTTAKGGLNTMMKALAHELGGHGITANAIAPGFTATEFTAPLQADEAFTKAMLARVPAGRWGRPSDLAPAVVFLASEAASYINGATLTVDGGFLAAG
jgi:gluconate 5-dehydrogenase